MRRTKEIGRKSTGKRKRNSVIYLICEGSETEIRYFKKFRKRGCNIDIIPISSQYKAADKLVQKAKSTMGFNPYYPEDGDMIWCVFDRDDNTNQMLISAKELAIKEGYKIAFSNPSFEIWFLLHFQNQTSEMENCDAVIRTLVNKGYLKDYKKNQDFYDILEPFQKQAIENSKKRIEKLEKNHIEIISRQSNPITTVSKLVEILNNLK